MCFSVGIPYPTMKLAITHPYSWPEVRRGAERITVETGRALAARGHEVTVFSAGESATKRRADGVTTVRYRRVFDNSLRHERWFGWRVLPDLVRGRFDAVHSLMPHDALAAIRARRLTGHVTVYEEMGNPYRWWWERLPDQRVRERVVRDIDVYACMSRYALRVLEEEWKRGGVVIPGGVRLDEFAPAIQRAPEPTILFSGAVAEPWKHLDTLLEAVALLAGREPGIRLVLSGPGDPAPLLAAAPLEARTRTTVLDLGAADQQAERYGNAWVTALPSEADSFGMALVESLACGTPIVVSDNGAPPELVTSDTGAVARLGDAEALASALTTALDLARREETRERCRERASEFDWDAIAPFLEKLYTRTITGALFGDGSTRAA
jgi:phosphatidyl-myo-inositol alpha-mannosyltransferase